MIRGLYTSAMGMILQEKRQSNISNNLSNIETNAFKKQEIIARAFDRVEVLNRDNGSRRLTPIGGMHLGVQVDDLYGDFQQGQLKETNETLDFAIEGTGFFTIQLPDGNIAYTRDGSFKVDGNGYLATKQGYLVMARNPISGGLESIPLDRDQVQVDDMGRMTLTNGQVYLLNIVDFPDHQQLRRLGENLYVLDGGQPMVAVDYKIMQGFLERSNVNPLEEMVKMIEVTRSFESNQKAVQSMDETLGKAANEVGKVG
jgi:flagellar basal-body rod protein FlgG